MKASLFALCLVPMAVGACMAETQEDTCGMAALQDLVGTEASGLEAVTLPEGTRIILPGMAVTMDYSPSRLNIDVGEDGLVTRLWCG